MKKVYITLIMTFVAISSIAQNRSLQERGFMGANPAMLEPQITVEQQEAISKLRFELNKELLPINNELAEKRVQLRSLKQEEKPKMKAVNSKIDEITDLHNKKMKLVANFHVEVRKHLTEEQRLAYDLRMSCGRRGSKRGSMNYRGEMNSRRTMNSRGNRNPRESMNNRWNVR